MAAYVEYRQKEMSYGEIKEKEKGVDLSLLVNLNESKLNLSLLQFHETSEFEPENSLMSETRSIMHGQSSGADGLLNSNRNTTNYDWLFSPPCNPVRSPITEEQKTLIRQNEIFSGQPPAPDSRLENPPAEPTSKTNVAPRRPASYNGVKSSTSAVRKPSPSRKATSAGSRPATPTARSTLPSTPKPLRSSPPTSRATAASTNSVAPPKRSSTPTSSAWSSTPMPQPSILAASKSTSRSSTPTQRPSNSSSLPSNGGRSSSGTKSRAPSLKNPASSRGNSPSVKSRPSKITLEMPGFSTEANLKKSLPERPATAIRGRPGLPGEKLPSAETISKAMPKRSSCSPFRGQVSNGGANNSVRGGVTRNQGSSNGNDDVNPVLMGTMMVERVVNMRKLAPPKQDDHLSDQNNISGKLALTKDNSGFGRTLSKKSLDMALRHLDIRRSMPGNMRSLITKVPASVYSLSSESTRSRTVSASLTSCHKQQ